MAAEEIDHDKWEKLVSAEYFENASGEGCGYNCVARRKVVESSEEEEEEEGPSESSAQSRGLAIRGHGNSFCVSCKQGSLCDIEFKEEARPHYEHERLQVYKVTGEFAVRKADMTKHLDTTTVLMHMSNGHAVHDLRTRKPLQESKKGYLLHSRVWCNGCGETVTNASTSECKKYNKDNAKVCSLQCFLTFRGNSAAAAQDSLEDSSSSGNSLPHEGNEGNPAPQELNAAQQTLNAAPLAIRKRRKQSAPSRSPPS